MKRPIIAILVSYCLWMPGCSSEKCRDGINLLPMYGGVPKCEEQLNDDKNFIAECDAQYKDRQMAAKYHLDKGWEYYYKNDFEASMKSFNHAWLLDSSIADLYWGFGNLLAAKQEFRESIPLLQKSVQLNPANAKVFESIATSYWQLYVENQDPDLLNKAVDNLKMSIRLDPKNAGTFGQLTTAYSHFEQKDSALKYLELTDKLDSAAVNPEIRKLLTGN